MARTRTRTRTALSLLVLGALALTACGDAEDAAGGVPEVASASYPMTWLVERVAGDTVGVEDLTPPGAEPHDLELTPQQVAGLSEVDLVAYVRGFQPAVDEAVEQQAADRAFDGGDAVALLPGYQRLEDGEQAETSEDDPHVWLDPLRYADLGEALAARLGELVPERAADVTAGAQALRADLEALDADYRAGLADCERREVFTTHNAFGYLTSSYDLEQVAVLGLTPEDEPASGRLAEVSDLARSAGATTVFFEETASPAVAEALAAEVGAEAVVLSPLEVRPDAGDYLDAMRANLATLQAALGCSTA